MTKIVDGLVDLNLRSDVSLDTRDTSNDYRDYDNNGMTPEI